MESGGDGAVHSAESIVMLRLYFYYWILILLVIINIHPQSCGIFLRPFFILVASVLTGQQLYIDSRASSALI